MCPSAHPLHVPCSRVYSGGAGWPGPTARGRGAVLSYLQGLAALDGNPHAQGPVGALQRRKKGFSKGRVWVTTLTVSGDAARVAGTARASPQARSSRQAGDRASRGLEAGPKPPRACWLLCDVSTGRWDSTATTHTCPAPFWRAGGSAGLGVVH